MQIQLLEDLKQNEPKKWWSECKRLCGMSKPSRDIVATLLPGSISSIEDKHNLANKINIAFTKPQESYLPLSPANRIDTLNANLPVVSLNVVEKSLSTVSLSKACRLDNVPN